MAPPDDDLGPGRQPSTPPDQPGQDELERIYAARFDGLTDQRSVMWKTLVDAYFQQFVGPADTVLDLAAGYCEFINNVRCGTKIAVDMNPSVKQMAGADVDVHLCASTELPDQLSGRVDVVWVSNFFEHLDNKDQFLATLREVHRVLRPGGRLMVLQPNIRLTREAYWDFVDHSLAITDRSLVEALELTGFEIDLLKVRFLPYTTNQRLPSWPALIRLYLKVPPVQYLLGQQTFAVARSR